MKPKRLISLLVAVCMMITMLPLSAVTAFAANTSSSTGTASSGGYKYEYKVNEDGTTATITDFRGPTDGHFYDIDIPDNLGDGNYTVTAIGNFAFSSCTYLRNVTIPQSVTSIGKGAFLSCHKLTNVTIPQSVTSIGEYAFEFCDDLTNVTIPEKVKKIEYGTFASCFSLESITLPAGLTSFQNALFFGSHDSVIYYNIDRATANEQLKKPDYSALNDAVQEGHKLLCLCHVTFDANGGELNDSAKVPVYETEKITDTKANELKANDPNAIPKPTRTGYTFTGWYTKDGEPFNVDKTITKDITYYADWAPVYHPLTVTGGIVTVEKDGQPLNIVPVVTGDKKTYSVP